MNHFSAKRKEYVITQLLLSETLRKVTDFNRRRIYDMTKNTDDPGNTELHILLIPFNDNYDWVAVWAHIPMIILELQDIFDSSGDHHEEVLVTAQNSEVLIILNFNK